MRDGIRGTVTRVAGLAMVLVVAGCGPGAPSAPEAATTEAVEPDQLEQAVADAAGTLLDAAAVETGLVSRTPDGEPNIVRWTVRVDEDTHKSVQVRRREGDAIVPAGVDVIAQVVTDGGNASAGLSPGIHRGPWTRHEGKHMPVWREGSPDNPLQLASGDVLTTEADDVDASVRWAADGTATWTATWQADEGVRTLTYSWTVAPDGHLSEHQATFSGSDGEVHERTRFEPKQAAPAITLPTEGAELELDQLGIWPDLPLPTPEPS